MTTPKRQFSLLNLFMLVATVAFWTAAVKEGHDNTVAREDVRESMSNFFASRSAAHNLDRRQKQELQAQIEQLREEIRRIRKSQNPE